jgi:hypothetical protein
MAQLSTSAKAANPTVEDRLQRAQNCGDTRLEPQILPRYSQFLLDSKRSVRDAVQEGAP